MSATSVRSTVRAVLLGALGSAAALGAAAGIEACGAQTSGDRVVLETQVALGGGGASFTTATGWDVTLIRALVSIGALYYFDGAPLASAPGSEPASAQRRGLARELAWLGLGSALAHPGHEHTGSALGQMLEPWSTDLIAGMATLPAGDGVTGTYRSASFSFGSPALGPFAGELGPHAALAEGVAVRAGARVRFRALAAQADVARSTARGYVDGCQFSELEVLGSGMVTLTVLPQVWLDHVDFATLPIASRADAPVEFPAGSAAQLAFVEGLAQLTAYHFAFTAF